MSSRFLTPFLSLVFLIGSQLNLCAYDVFQDPAGNVYVLAFDNLDYSIGIRRLTSDGQPLQVSVNDTPGTWDVSLFSAPRSVTVLLGSGDNILSVSGGINGDVSIVSDSDFSLITIEEHVAGDLTIDSGNAGTVNLSCSISGNTQVASHNGRLSLNIKNSVFEGDVNVSSGPETDRIYIGETTTSVVSSNPYANNRFYGRTVIETTSAPSKTFDVIHFNQVEFWGPLEVRTGDGGDIIWGGERFLVPIGYFIAHDSVLIETGGGDDDVNLTTCTFNESFTLRTGNQSDFVTLGESSFTGTTRIEMGSSNDTLDVEQATFSTFLSTVLDGGSGNSDNGRSPRVARGKTFFPRNFESGRLK